MNKEPQLSFETVLPIEEHARIIMEWRNDPETLQMSFHPQAKKWQSFWDTFEADFFNTAQLTPLFVLCEGKRVAFIRFRQTGHPEGLDRHVEEISINVAPSFRGKGIGTAALKQVCQWVKQQNVDDLYAEIKEENRASHQAFKKAGYSSLGERKKYIEDTGSIYTIHSYLLPLTPIEKNRGVFIIAEAGSNWRMGAIRRDKAMARALIEVAAEAGVDAVKFQTFRPESVYVHNAGQSNYLADAGIMEDISSIFTDLSMPYEMLVDLAAICKDCGVEFMSSPFSEKDFSAVDPYVRHHKIASYENGHVHLLSLAARSLKPIFISTGASTEEDIAWALHTFYSNGGKEATLMQCTARYPADPAHLNLKSIPWMRNRFNVPVGLSDHSSDPILAPVCAVALGASAIEKHFTLSKQLPGPDHFFALEPKELKAMVAAVREAELVGGASFKQIIPAEEELRHFARRGIQAMHDIQEGESFEEGKNIAILRPGNQEAGVHPRFLKEIEGKRSQRVIPAGNGLRHGDWEL